MTGAWSARLAARLAALGILPEAARGPGPASARRPGPGSGRVGGLAVEPGLVTARVRDTDAPGAPGARAPWTVRLALPVLSDAEWRRAERALAADTAVREQLLDGELPPDADALFARAGLPLLPAADGELAMACDCPDWAVPCAHLAAVLAALGAAFDDEPFLVTAWRGRDRRAVLDAARNGPAPAAPADTPEAPQAPVAPDAPDFWGGGDLPDRRPGVPASPAVAELGRPAVTVRGRTLSDVLAPAYEAFLTW